MKLINRIATKCTLVAGLATGVMDRNSANDGNIKVTLERLKAKAETG